MIVGSCVISNSTNPKFEKKLSDNSFYFFKKMGLRVIFFSYICSAYWCKHRMLIIIARKHEVELKHKLLRNRKNN